MRRTVIDNSPEAAACFHCGQTCGAGAVLVSGRHFCCTGCNAVFSLLTESGLSQYYELGAAPGASMKQQAAVRAWGFLDEASVQEKLLDFASEKNARVTLHLPTIHCVACVWLLENLFRLQDGVGESRVDFVRREVRISFDPQRVKLSEVASLLASLGYEPKLTLGELDKDDSSKKARWRERQWLQLGIAGFGFGNVMLLALPGYLGLDSWSGPWFKSFAGWLSLILALPVVTYSAGDYWRTASTNLRRRALTLEIPIALGLLAIYAQSVFEVASGREGYADSLTGLIFFLLCGRLFQRKTFDSLVFDRDYKGFFPLAVVRKSGSEEETIAISQVAVGDRLIIRHGELVSADARLVSGQATIDYSFVTGESEPVTRHSGEIIHAGGRQTGGAIEVETVKPVSESYLTALWNNEAFRKQRDDDLDSLINRYSPRFTFIVLAIAVGAGLFWLFVNPSVALKAFASVLIVACPCALALAAPLTLGSAHRGLANRGVFLRNSQVVERMAEVDTIVFDKTGTLTTSLGGTVQWHGLPLTATQEECLVSMFKHSSHPLALCIGDSFRKDLSVRGTNSFEEISGCGMQGTIGAHAIWIGSESWLVSLGIIQAADVPGDNSSRKASKVHVVFDGLYRGHFLVDTAVRPEVDALLARLRGQYELVLMSGDNPRQAELFRNLLGPNARLEFQLTPFDKLNLVKDLQARGRKVMMVGDGLNDAGALQQADVGIAVVEKAGTFSPASDVILNAAQLPRLAEVLTFSRRCARLVRAGFALSGIYNIAGVSIAAAGLLAPIVCAVLMPLSSASVVLFALGATRWIERRTFRTPRVSVSSESVQDTPNLDLLSVARPPQNASL